MMNNHRGKILPVEQRIAVLDTQNLRYKALRLQDRVDVVTVVYRAEEPRNDGCLQTDAVTS